MRAFTFRFEKLLNYRKQVEEINKIIYQGVVNLLRKCINELRELKTSKQQIFEKIKVLQNSNKLDELQLYYNHLLFVDKLLGEKRQELKKLRERETEAHASYLKARQDREVLEKLKERKMNDYNIELSREEQKILTEVGLNIWKASEYDENY